MSERFDQLSKDLARGMSRREAARRMVMSLGATLVGLTAFRTASAQSLGNNECVEYCRAMYPGGGKDFGKCVSHSAKCPPGMCYGPVPIDLNGGGSCDPNMVINGCGPNVPPPPPPPLSLSIEGPQYGCFAIGMGL